MNSDFWKRFPVIPGFDCIKMKRDIQAKIHEETKHMRIKSVHPGFTGLSLVGSILRRLDRHQPGLCHGHSAGAVGTGCLQRHPGGASLRYTRRYVHHRSDLELRI